MCSGHGGAAAAGKFSAAPAVLKPALNFPASRDEHAQSLWEGLHQPLVLQPGAQSWKKLPDLFNTSLGTEDFIKFSKFHECSEDFLKIKLFLILIVSIFLKHFQNFPPSIGKPFLQIRLYLWTVLPGCVNTRLLF